MQELMVIQFLTTLTQPVLNNQWIHLVAIYDGPNGTLKLYLNGEEISSTTGITNVLPTNTYGFTMGRAANYFDTYTYF